ncbi:hypothetical protein EIN_414430 [Entamoeba invadens IP1]|uniref:Uncharacterized protein n=1 Tax=Entamoeba invadens IP1 TaxID=370355 RepID=L7FLB3_ENTIV|nr:hypothetical protein EIN_414430 [Entamoeba invadens IP1]ELP87068.1 hypothetical protein EIN_414430 [Entamoeba invadens IP1]|eukprot:XP_004253839.1 hypothetical protein EIN_414430 [Entamoeba invadens IP1]
MENSYYLQDRTYVDTTTCSGALYPLPDIIYTSLGCIDMDGSHFTLNVDDKKVYFKSYKDKECKTPDTENYEEDTFRECSGSGSYRTKYYGPTLYAHQEEMYTQTFIPNKCYVSPIDDTKFVEIKDDEKMYTADTCDDLKASTTEVLDYKIEILETFPAYYYRAVYYGKNDCNMTANLDITPYPDMYFTKDNMCISGATGYKFETNKTTLTSYYFSDGKCATPNEKTPKLVYAYQTCEKDIDEDYYIYYYGNDTTIPTPIAPEAAFGLIVVMISMIIFALF